MRRKGLIVGLLIAVASCGLYAATQWRGGGPTGESRRVPVSAEEINRALDLQIYSFELKKPENGSGLHVWLERWTRDAKEPEIYVLATIGCGSADGGTLTVALPTKERPETYISWLGVTSRSNPGAIIDMKGIDGSAIMEPRTALIDEDLPLLALMSNSNHVITADTEHVEQDHDVTYYLRARFTPGTHLIGASAKWKDGKVLFE